MDDFINLLERFYPPPVPRTPPRAKKHRVFKDPQLCTLYQFIRVHGHDPYWGPKCRLARFALGTGLRVNEIVHQTRETMENTDRGVTVSVAREWSKNHQAREAPAIPELVPFLRTWIDGLTEGEYLFHQPNGKPYTTRTMERWWNEVTERARVPNLDGIHGARHTYATQELVARRLELWQVSGFLGHSKFSITVDYYSHALAECAFNHEPPAWWAVASCQDRPQLKAVG